MSFILSRYECNSIKLDFFDLRLKFNDLDRGTSVRMSPNQITQVLIIIRASINLCKLLVLISLIKLSLAWRQLIFLLELLLGFSAIIINQIVALE